MDIFTKIICSIGPSTDSLDEILELINSGMNVARINFSHGDYDSHKKIFEKLKIARKSSNKPIAIMMDTKGPEIRVVKVFNDSVEVKKGDRFCLVDAFSNRKEEIEIQPKNAISCLKNGKLVLFKDGYIESKVVEDKDQIIIEILNDGVLENKAGVNIPDCDLDIQALTGKDIEDIKFGCQNGADIVAASFVRSKEDVLTIKKILFENGYQNVMVIAKIESKSGIKNFDTILEVADGIMVARGDLGVEIDLSKIPKLQKEMIKKSNLCNKPIIIATQMLESMIIYPRPTRAEVSDVANAIYDGTSAVMLSGETAAGKYPIEATRQMKKIIVETEKDLEFLEKKDMKDCNVSLSVAIAAVKTAYSSKAKAFFVYSSSGFTAKLLSSLRPSVVVIALTKSRITYNQLSLIWGVIPVYTKECKNAVEAFDITSKYALDEGILKFGDLVVVTAGIPFGRKGSTNLMALDSIGHIVVRGKCGNKGNVDGSIAVVCSFDKVKEGSLKDKIVVLSFFDDQCRNALQKVKGVVLQNGLFDEKSRNNATSFCREIGVPCLVDAENAITLLSDGNNVCLDAGNGFVYFIKDKI